MNYTKSIFTVEEELSNNELLVYNVLTQSYFFVDASYKDKHWYNFEKSPIKEELIRGKFIVPIDYDEKSDLLGKLETISDYNNMLDLTLLLTTDCNMKCIYCYEENITKMEISEKVICDFIDWANHEIKLHNVDYISILLFGGEPLIDIDRLLYVVDKINQNINLNNRINYGIGTNGTNMPKKAIEKLVKKGLSLIQITIDGPAEIHNYRRPLKNNNTKENNYKNILKNIDSIKKLSEEGLKIIIKINIDKNNIDSIPRLLDDLTEMNLEKYIELKFEAIALTNESNKIESHFCNLNVFDSRKKELADTYFDCINLAKSKNFSLSNTIGNITPCMYTSKNSFVINSDGSIYKCISAVSLNEFKIGHIKEAKFNNNYFNALNRLNIAKKCLDIECPFVPKCGGGCAYESFIKDDDINKIDCKKEFNRFYYINKFISKRNFDKLDNDVKWSEINE